MGFHQIGGPHLELLSAGCGTCAGTFWMSPHVCGTIWPLREPIDTIVVFSRGQKSYRSRRRVLGSTVIYTSTNKGKRRRMPLGTSGAKVAVGILIKKYN